MTAKLKVGESENVHTYNIWIVANVVSGDDDWIGGTASRRDGGVELDAVLSTMRLPGNLRRSRSTGPQAYPLDI